MSFVDSHSFHTLRAISFGSTRRQMDEIYEEFRRTEEALEEAQKARVELFARISKGASNPRNCSENSLRAEISEIGKVTRMIYSRQNELRERYEEMYNLRIGSDGYQRI